MQSPLLKSLSFCVCCVLLPYLASAQDTLVAREYFTKGRQLGVKAQYDSSDYYLTRSKQLFEEAGSTANVLEVEMELITNLMFNNEYAEANQRLESILARVRTSKEPKLLNILADTYFNKAGFLFRTGDYAQAIIYSDSSLNIYKNKINKKDIKVGINYNLQAISNRRLGEYKSAVQLFEKAYENFLSNEDNQGIASVKNNLGNLYESLGYLRKAVQSYLVAIETMIKLYGNEHSNLGVAYDNLANLYQQLGDYEQAEYYAYKTITIAKKVFGETHELFAHGHLNLSGIYFRKKEIRKSIKTAKIAERIYNQLNPEHPYLINTYQGLGESYLLLNKADSAGLYFQKHTATIRKKMTEEKGKEFATIYFNQSRLDALKKNSASQLKNLTKTLEILEKSELQKHQLTTETFTELANIEIKLGNQTNAISYLNKAIESCVETFTVTENHYTIKNIISELGLIQALGNKAAYLSSVGENKQALNYYITIDSLADLQRNTYSRESTKINFSELINTLYNQAFECVYKLYQADNDHSYIDLALQFSEKRKGQILLDQVNSKNAIEFGNIPLEVRNKEADFQDQLVKARNQLRDAFLASSTPLNQELNNQLFSIEKRYDSLLRRMESDYPEYYKLKYLVDLVDILKIRTKIVYGDNHGFIEYYLTPSTTYAIVITSNEDTLVQLGNTISIQQLIGDYLTAVQQSDSNADTLSFILYNTLIKPLPWVQSLYRIKIVPSGIIGYLPFETLLSELPAANMLQRNKSWLLKYHRISYAYSANLLLNQRTIRHKKAPLALAIAPSFDDHPLPLAPLSGAIKEANYLNKIMAGVLLTDSMATKTRFKQLSGDYSIIHLATYALLDEQNPMNSKLLFSITTDSIDDGYLYSYELYKLNLKADLVTLSACNSRIGSMSEGEGIMSLARSFAYAGSPSLLISLWPVADINTAELMRYFYTNLKNGMTKDEALHQAKLSYLDNQHNLVASPYYWGGFIITGQAEALKVRHLYLYYLIAFFVMAGAAIILFKNKLSKLI